MKITTGKIPRAQRVVLYGVESVGKTTLAAKAPRPLFLDVEGGTAHLDVPRCEPADWQALTAAVTECAKLSDFDTIVIDSIDWAERLCIEHFLDETKKRSIEDIPYGKGWVQVAERMARFLASLDTLIAAGKHVLLIGHSQIKRVEPPDLMSAYDRYELKLAKQSAPLVKEWADELWFAHFKTKVVEADNGRAKATGGRARILHTTHSAAYDAKTRSGLDDELPMEWESIAHVFSPTAPVGKPAAQPPATDIDNAIGFHEADVNAFLRARGVITPEQVWTDAPADYLARVRADHPRFLQTVARWVESTQPPAAQ